MSRATEHRQSWRDVFADYPAPANLAPEAMRRNIGIVDECLQDLWNLGENIFLAWTSRGERTLLLALPYYLLAEYVSGARPIKGEPRPEEYIGGLISGSKHLAADELQGVADKLGVAPQSVRLPFRPNDGVGRDLMSALVQRYGLAYTRNRPVLLVDIVGFSLFPAMEQVVLLQSLSHSVNSAYSKLAARNFRINFARSTTGDGFYIWNRADTLEGSAHLYTLMLLMLADNAIAQGKARSRTVPRLRAAFHVGTTSSTSPRDSARPASAIWWARSPLPWPACSSGPCPARCCSVISRRMWWQRRAARRCASAPSNSSSACARRYGN